MSGIAATMSVGLWMKLAVDPELGAGEHHREQAEQQDIHRQPPEVADADGALVRAAAGEIAEIQDHGAVEGDPERRAAEDLQPHLRTAHGVAAGPGDGGAGAQVHPGGEGGDGEQDHRSGEGFVATHHLHAVGEDQQLHAPDGDEGRPAQARQAEDRILVVGREARPDRRQQDAQDDRGEIGLDAEPGDGDHRADQRGKLRAMDAEGDPAHHRVGQAGLLAHVAGQVHQPVDHQRAQGQRGEDLRAAHAEGEEADGEGVVGDVVHVVGPQREQAVASPATPFGLARGEVGAVQARAQRRQFAAGVMAGAGQAIETGGSAQVQARRRELRCAQPGAGQAVETGRSAQVEHRGGELGCALAGPRQMVEAFQGAEVEQRGENSRGAAGGFGVLDMAVSSGSRKNSARGRVRLLFLYTRISNI